MNKTKLNIRSLVYSQLQMETYVLVLAEENGERKLPIVIAINDAQAIAMALESMKPARPLTHDLFVSFAAAHNTKVTEVQIVDFKEGVFYAELVCENATNTIRISARTSDAVALAIRFKCPIYIYDNILAEAGIITTDFDDLENELPEENEVVEDLKSYSVDELKEILEDAINEEDYEFASNIRDEINSRK